MRADHPLRYPLPACPACSTMPMPDPATFGLHHVRLPVADVLRSRDWYLEVLDFFPLLVLEEEDDLVGVVLTHPSGLVVGLHAAPERASALRGFAVLALRVDGRPALEEWCARLDRLAIEHSGITASHLGWCVNVPDPDGVFVQLHTTQQPAADEA
jgi:catechol 2,3-dioxygenase-like lactoylglutathione lyase family enzyme